jgi:hypothetical protein
MDIVAVLIEVLRVTFGFLLLLFLPGFNLSLIFFPRWSDLNIIDRLVYSTVLSISSVIALVLFMDVVLGVNTTPRNITLFICVFSLGVLLVWWCERFYLNSRLKKRLEPQLTADYEKLQKYYSRETHAARDRFRQDTRTKVVYHESQQSGLNHIEHSYLMDVGDEIAIHQVMENKLKVTESVMLEPPYPETRYFEVAIREYKEESLSLVDDLQIYPVLTRKNPDRTVFRFVIRPGSIHIAERIYKKTSTSETQWIYSHDFHIFAIVNAEDTLEQMVNRILGKLDEIVESLKNGAPVSSYAEDRQILQEAYEAEIGLPHAVPAGHTTPPQRQDIWPSIEPSGIITAPEVQAGVEPEVIPKWPVIRPGVEPAGIVTAPEVQAGAEQEVIPKWPVIRRDVEPAGIVTAPEAQAGAEQEVIPKWPVIRSGVEPAVIVTAPEVQAGAEQEVIPKRPVIRPSVEPAVIVMAPAVQTPAEPAGIPKRAVIPREDRPTWIDSGPELASSAEPLEVLKRVEVQPDVKPTGTPKPPEAPTVAEPREIPREITKRPVIPTRVAPGRVPGSTETHPHILPEEKTRRPVLQPDAGPGEIFERTEVRPLGQQKEIPEHPVILPGIEPRDVFKQTEVRSRVQPRIISKSPVIPQGNEPKRTLQRPEVQPVAGPKVSPQRTETKPGIRSKDILNHPENKLGVEPIRKFQRDIIRDLNVFGVTSESFRKPEKNVENIPIPKKSDVNKKLTEIKEDKDVDWRDLEWLYE